MSNPIRGNIEINFNGRSVSSEIKKVQDAAKLAGEAIAKMDESQRVAGNATYDALKKTVDVNEALAAKMKRANVDIDGVLNNLSGSTLRKLKEAMNAVKNQMRGLTGDELTGSKGIKLRNQYQQLAEQINKVNQAMGVNTNLLNKNTAAHKNNESGISKTIRRLADYVMVYWSFNQLIGLTRSWISGNKELSESLTNVRKVTGLTGDEIDRLSKSIDDIDTSTAQLALTNLAYDAGKLGIKGVQNIYEFVRAGNQIKVALGADLGEDAIKNLAKLNDVLGITKKMGVEKSLLATGSAINELGMNSTASEGYLVDFAQRLGGIAAVSHMTMADLLALGATTDALAQNVEVSATAMNKVIMTMMTDTERVARAAGMTRDELQKQLDVSTMQGLVSVLDGLQSKGGIEQMGDIFKDLGSDGARLKGVIAALVPNVEMLRAQIYISNKGFEEGVSVTKEYEMKQQSLGAIMAKTGNRIKESFINSSMVQTMTRWANALNNYDRTLHTSHATIGMFTGGITLMTLAIITNKTHVTSWTRLLAVMRSGWVGATGAINKARLAVVAFAKTPMGIFSLILSAVVAIGTAIYRKATYVSTATRAWNDYERAMSDARLEIDSSFAALNRATIARERANDVLSKTTAGTQEASEAEAALRSQTEKRNAVIQEMNQKYGNYLANMLSEKMTTEELATAKERLVAAMMKESALKGKERVTKDIREDYAGDLKSADERARKRLDNQTNDRKLTQDVMDMAARMVMESVGTDTGVGDIMKNLGEKLKGEEFEGKLGDFKGNLYAAVRSYVITLKESEDEVYKATSAYDKDIAKFDTEQRVQDEKIFSSNLTKNVESMKSRDIENTVNYYKARIEAEGEGFSEYEKARQWIMQAEQALFDRNTTKKDSDLTEWSINQLKEEMKVSKEGIDLLRPDMENYEQKLQEYKDRISAARKELISRGEIEEKGPKTPKSGESKLMKELRLELKGVQTEYENHQAELKRLFTDGEISETQLNQRMADAEAGYLKKRAETALAFQIKKKTNEKAVKEEVALIVAQSASKELEIEVEKQKQLQELYYAANPVKRVREEYTQRFQQLGAFGDTEVNMTREEQEKRLGIIDGFAAEVVSLDNDAFRERLQSSGLFGSEVETMTEEHLIALRELYDDYYLSQEEAQQKADERELKLIEKKQRMILRSYNQSDEKKKIDTGNANIKNESDELDMLRNFGGISETDYHMKQIELSEARIAMLKRELEAKKEHAGEVARLNGLVMEEQGKMLNSTLSIYSKMGDTMDKWGSTFGSAMYGAVTDGKKGRQKLAAEMGRLILDLSANYARQLLMQSIFSKAKLTMKSSEVAAEQGLNATSIAGTAAKESAETAITASGTVAEGTMQGAKWFAKAIGSLGPIAGPILGALGVSMIAAFISSALSKVGQSDKDTEIAQNAVTKPAPGMLTYAKGKYDVLGDDGVSYNAGYEPRLQTGIYHKPHFALFGERGPEMVIDAPTTRKLVMDFPGTYNSLLSLARTGTMRTYADGTMPYAAIATGGMDSETMARINETMLVVAAMAKENSIATAALREELHNGIGVNMYGPNGLQNSSTKASRFARRNRIG